MFEVFIREKRKVRILQRDQDSYITGYITHFHPSNRLVIFQSDETHEIPVDEIIHLYQAK